MYHSILSRLASLTDTLTPALASRRMIHRLSTRPGNKTKFVQCGGGHIRYLDVGQGDHTLVIAVDPPVVIENYNRLIEELGDEIRIIIFEAPGFGFSYPSMGMDFGFENVTSLMEEFLVKMDAGPCVLLFPCLMGYSAIDIAARRADLVSHIVMMQTPSWRDEVKWKAATDTKDVLNRPFLGQVSLRLARSKQALGWMNYATWNDTGKEEAAREVGQSLDQGACFCLASSYQKYLTEKQPDFGAISQPCLVVWGARDRSHKRTDMRSSLELAPNGKLTVFEEAGHFPDLEQPGLFSRTLLDWLEANPASRTSP